MKNWHCYAICACIISAIAHMRECFPRDTPSWNITTMGLAVLSSGLVFLTVKSWQKDRQ